MKICGIIFEETESTIARPTKETTYFSSSVNMVNIKRVTMRRRLSTDSTNSVLLNQYAVVFSKWNTEFIFTVIILHLFWISMLIAGYIGTMPFWILLLPKRGASF